MSMAQQIPLVGLLALQSLCCAAPTQVAARGNAARGQQARCSSQGYTVELRPLVSRLRPRDPVRVALHFSKPGKRWIRIDRARTRAALVFEVEDPRGKGGWLSLAPGQGKRRIPGS